MLRRNPNDICIGKDKWICFVDLAGRQSTAIELDPILRPIEMFFDSLETECVAGCCGIDAYSFWPEDIARAAKQSLLPNLLNLIDSARQQVVESGGDLFVSDRMNNYFDRKTLLELMDHIAFCVSNANTIDA